MPQGLFRPKAIWLAALASNCRDCVASATRRFREQYMSNITAAQRSEFSATLQQRAAALREEVRQTLLRTDQEHYLAVAEQVRDLEDESFADLIVDVNLAEVDRDLAELRQIDMALARVAQGTYGRCKTCGEDIDRARLRAQPSALRCLRCQAAHERSHPQPMPSL